MADEYFIVVMQRQEKLNTDKTSPIGQAMLALGDRFIGRFEEPPIPVDLYADQSGLWMRPTQSHMIESAEMLTAQEGGEDQVDSLDVPDTPQFQKVVLNRGQQLTVIGTDGTKVTIYPQFRS